MNKVALILHTPTQVFRGLGSPIKPCTRLYDTCETPPGKPKQNYEILTKLSGTRQAGGSDCKSLRVGKNRYDVACHE